jgi:hypothetical protein
MVRSAAKLRVSNHEAAHLPHFLRLALGRQARRGPARQPRPQYAGETAGPQALADARLLNAGWRSAGPLQALRTAGLRGRTGLRRRTGWCGRAGPSDGSRLIRLTRARRQSGLPRRTGPCRSRSLQLLTLPVGRARLLRRLRLTRPVLQARLPARSILSRQSVLLRPAARRVAAVEARIGAAEFALLAHDLPSEILRRVNLAHKTLVAQHLLR